MQLRMDHNNSKCNLCFDLDSLDLSHFELEKAIHYGGQTVSHETIYKHVWENKRQGDNLYKNLRHHGKKYNKRGSGKAGRGCIPGRVDIADRPAVVDEKSRLGDWELDTIIGKEHKGALVSMVERHSKLTRLAKVKRKTALE